MTVTELQQRMGQREFVHWQAYYALRAKRDEIAAKQAKRGR